MVNVTILYTLVMVFLAARSKRGTAVGLLILSTLLWPDYLRYPVFSIQMSASRTVAFVLLFKYYFKGKKNKRLSEIDKLIIAGYLWDIFANVVAGANSARLTSLIGRGLDTVLIYFSVRYTINNKTDLKDLINPLVLCGIILGAFGVYEAVTYYSPYQKLMEYHTWLWYKKDLEYRLDFLRAQASTAHPIYFGMSMFFILGLLVSLRGMVVRKKLFLKLGILGALFGAFSTLSSGPIISASLFIGFSMLYYKQSMIKPVIYLVILAMVSIEILSNRHFYNLVDYIALSSGNAWYRTRLLEVAINQWHEYWLFGFKGSVPHHWGPLIDGRNHVDLVNNYITTAVVGGFPSMIILIRIQYLVIKKALLIWKMNDEQYKIYSFGIISLSISFMLGSMSVGIYSSALIISYIFYASTSWVFNDLNDK